MDAISNTAQTPPLPTPVTQTESEVSTAALASDFETFLKLLTTQLQNQDPSKPLDSTEFVAQLASFSAVEQQINTNTKLDELISRINYGNTSDLSSWLGANVKSEANANFSGSPIPLPRIRTDPTDSKSNPLKITSQRDFNLPKPSLRLLKRVSTETQLN